MMITMSEDRITNTTAAAGELLCTLQDGAECYRRWSSTSGDSEVTQWADQPDQALLLLALGDAGQRDLAEFEAWATAHDFPSNVTWQGIDAADPEHEVGALERL